MHPSRYVIMLLLAGCVAAPILIGASCPPPITPVLTGIVPDNNGVQQQKLAACVPDFICVNLANGSPIPVLMALYKHNGFDPNDQFADPPQFSCCTNPNSTVACPCPCTGKSTGNCRLDRTEIFLTTNLTPVNGATSALLVPNQGSLVRFRCGDVKTLGASVAPADGDPVAAPVDKAGPVYRGEFGGVACGQTVQFMAVDLSQTGGTGGSNTPNTTATLIIQTSFSQ